MMPCEQCDFIGWGVTHINSTEPARILREAAFITRSPEQCLALRRLIREGEMCVEKAAVNKTVIMLSVSHCNSYLTAMS